ncbi:MAG: autotransporter-associated beta strand repeat-containing protein [Lentisphaerae bacterium]|nr:autotransporter-associated beta strand repeat-containing protein [Lentisphaerota bacterium]
MLKRIDRLTLSLLVFVLFSQPALADTIIKANNGNNLNLSTSWVTNGPPTPADIGRWDNTVATAGVNTGALGVDMTWDGIQFVNPAAATWTVTGANVLTLGASGIDMASATKNLALNCGLSLGATQPWTVASARTLSVGGSVAGAGRIIKAGAGTLTLSAANSFSGGLELGGGTVSINADAALGDTDGDLAVTANSTLTITTSANLPSSRTVTLSAGATGDVSTTVSPVISGAVSGPGALSKSGTGTLALLGSNSYTGATVIIAGALRADDGTGLPSSSNLRLAGGVFEGNGAATFSRALGTGAGEVQWTSGGGFSASNGTLTVNLGGAGAGLVWGSTAGFVPSSSPLIFSHANADSTVQFENPIDLNGSVRTIQVDNGGADADARLTGALSGAGAGLTKTGTGRLELDGTQTFDGTLWVQNGALRLDTMTDSSPGSGTLKLGNATTTAELEYTGDTNTVVARPIDLAGTTGGARLTANGAGTLTLTANFTATGGNNKVLTLQGTNTDANTIGGAIPDNSGSFVTHLTKDGAGTWVLGGTNTYTGITSINDGTLKLATGSALSDAGTLTINGGILDLGGNSESVNAVTLVDGLITNGTLTAGTGFNAQAGTVSATLAGSGVTLTKTGTGALALTGSNTFSGIMTISNGKVVVTHLSDTTPGSGPIKLGSGSTSGELEYVGDTDVILATREVQLGGTSGDGILTVNGSGTLTVASQLRSTASSTSGHGLQLGGGNTGANILASALTNYVANASLLIKSGSGRWILTGTNTYTGTTTINGGTLQVGNGTDSGTLGTGAVTVTAPGGLAFSRSDTLISSNAISGTGTLTLDGAGTLVLAGATTHSGPTLLNVGTLRYGVANALPSATAVSNVTLQAGATLDLAGFNGTIAALNGAGLVDLSTGTGTNTLTLGNNSQPGTFSGRIQNTAGTLAVTKAGTGTQVLDGTNAFGGSLTISGGTLVLAGLNSYSGDSYVSAAATLRLGAADVIPNGPGKGDVLLQTTSCILDMNGFSDTINGLRSNAGAPAVDIVSAGGSVTLTLGDEHTTASYGGAIRNTTGTLSLTKIGNGTQTLAGANSYSGDTTISAGKLEIAGSTSIPSGAGKGNVIVATGATLEVNAPLTVNALSGGGTVDNDTVTIRVLTVGANDQSATFSGTLTNSGAVASLALTKIGTGTLVLTGDNGYGGATTISGGTLQIGDGGTTGSLGTGGTANSGALVINRTGTITYGGVMSGTGTLTKTGAGTLVLAGASTYFGNTTISAGTVRGGVANCLPGAVSSGSVQIDPGATLDLGGFNQSLGSLAGSGAVDNTLGIGTYTLSVGINNQSTSFSGAIGNTSGTVAFTKTGSGTLVLSGAHTYGGTTTIALGALKIGAANVIPNGPGKGDVAVTTANTCILDLAGFDETINGLTGLGVVTNSTGSSTLTIGDGNATASGSATLRDGDGTLALTKIGSGTQTMSGTSTYSGDTTVNSGTLKLGVATAIPSGPGRGNLHVAAGAVFDINTLATTLNGLWGAGVVTNSSTLDSLTVGANDQSSTFSGGIGTAITLFKTGTGQLTLAGANTHSGVTTVQGGVLAAQHGAALGGTGGATIVTNGATLAIENDILIGAEPLTLYGSGVTNSGALRSTGANTYGGTITLNADSRLQSDAQTLTLDVASGNAVNGAARTLTLGGAGDIVVADPISLTTGALVKDGAGKATVTATNSYSGGTTVNGGTLLVNNASGQGTGSGTVTVNGGGTLGGTGFITGTVTVNSGGTLSPGTSVGELTVGGLTLASGSATVIEFNGGPANDRIVVTGASGLTINGGGVYLYEEGSTTPWTQPGAYRLFQYSGAIGGVGAGALSVLNPQPGMTYSFRTAAGWVEVLVTGELPLVSIGPASVIEGNSGLTALAFPVTLTKTGTVTITGTFSTADGTARAATDYSAANNAPFSIPAGTTSGSIDVQVYGENAFELDETFTITITSMTNALLLDASATGTIQNDDAFANAWYVDDTATGNNNGYNWQDAFTDLQSALAVATSGQQVWVAEGTYYPTNASGSVTAVFRLKSNVALYGGFRGTETAIAQRLGTNVSSILSGDIGTAGAVFDNCSRVVLASSASGALLDGFVIRDAYGTQQGAGMRIEGAPVTVRHCVFEYNHGNEAGALHNNQASLIEGCIFRYNTCASRGGALQTYSSSPLLVNCVFHDNNSGDAGGAMSLYHQPMTLVNCTFIGNTCSSVGQCAYVSNYGTPTFINCILWDQGDSGGGLYPKPWNEINESGPISLINCDVNGGQTIDPTYQGTIVSVISDDPQFVNEGARNLHLQNDSPCVDTGTTEQAPADDADGGARPYGSGFDIGAYEYGASGSGERPVALMLIVR